MMRLRIDDVNERHTRISVFANDSGMAGQIVVNTLELEALAREWRSPLYWASATARGSAIAHMPAGEFSSIQIIMFDRGGPFYEDHKSWPLNDAGGRIMEVER